jgi:pimeloyl-ACP methyl ester carboxylesterase
VHTDALEARIISGQWHGPAADEAPVAGSGGERAWETTAADKDGWFAGRGGGTTYAWWTVESGAEEVMLLEAAGHNCVYVNGDIRAGDPYAYGYLHLPVLMRPGTNELLFQYSRDRLRAKLVRPGAPLLLDGADSTLPDIIVGEAEPVWVGVVALNATTNFVSVSLRAKGRRSSENEARIPPLGCRKCALLFYPPVFKGPTNWAVNIEASGRGAGGSSHAGISVSLRVRRADQPYKRTFLSGIDDSAQYYAVNPAPTASAASPNGGAPALFLSLHGASVEAMGQAEAYSAKRWGTIVCPTNRRPYGFDWEEWGRLDALEVLGLAQARFHPDPSRIYLTGHSMGGHGAWQLGALYPDHFAAIGPSAGWISFMSYTESNPPPSTNALERFLRRSAAAGDTLLMASNYLQEGVYILHGDKDDNVPVSEARQMREVLGRFHRDLDYHEQPGAGHWWDASDEPGTDCVDWAPMFDFFAHHAIPSDQAVRRVRFTTVNPAVSARAHWVTILAQEHSLQPSAVDIRCDPGKRRLVGMTTNVARLWLELPTVPPGAPLTVELDGQKLENVPCSPVASAPAGRAALGVPSPSVCLAREAGRWQLSQYPAASFKTPARSGPFRQAFCNRMLFVYGTQGTAEENAWALGKARYDAETFYYRGNGSVEVISDAGFCRELAGAGRKQEAKGEGRRLGVRGRNVILFGHADCNSAWPVLLANSPVQVHRGSVRAGSRELRGEDLACLFLQPRPQEDGALVGVVSGSGLPGLRLTERMPCFLSGAGFPDCLVAGVDMLTKGIGGVRGAGFFGPDWGVETGEFAWAEE